MVQGQTDFGVSLSFLYRLSWMILEHTSYQPHTVMSHLGHTNRSEIYIIYMYSQIIYLIISIGLTMQKSMMEQTNNSTDILSFILSKYTGSLNSEYYAGECEF